MTLTGRFHSLIPTLMQELRSEFEKPTHYEISANGNVLTLWGISTCKKCGCEMLDANWPMILDSPFGADWEGVPGLKNLKRGTWSENISEQAPEDLCAGCWVD